MANPNDAFVGRSLLSYGEFSGEEAEFLMGLIKPGDVVVDAGANIGALTVPMALAAGPAGHVLAFEPQRFVLHLLFANVALNQLTNVRVAPMALGAEPGEIRVPVLDPRIPFNFGGVGLREIPLDTRCAPVPVVPLDTYELERLNLLKADVEGMEADVIKGATETIRKCQPILYLEADRIAKQRELFDLVTALGYVLVRHTPPLYRPNNWRHEPGNIFGNIVSLNWIGVPEAQAADLPPELPRVTREQCGVEAKAA